MPPRCAENCSSFDTSVHDIRAALKKLKCCLECIIAKHRAFFNAFQKNSAVSTELPFFRRFRFFRTLDKNRENGDNEAVHAVHYE